MDKELIDRAWACLPREFREEVKKLYVDALDASNSPHDPDDRKWGNYRVTLLEKLFGIHNLTSDTEGEEMLTVPRKEVQERYAANERLKDDFPKSDIYLASNAINVMLQDLFGSKCLPDNVDSSESNVDSSVGSVESLETKPAEPKFKEGDKVRCVLNSKVYCVEGQIGKYHYALSGFNYDVHEDYLEPYTEPTCTNDCPSPCPSQDFDTILKDGFSNECRLTIAAMAMQGMLSNTTRFSSYEISDLVRISLNCADALITESEKGGEQ